MQTLHLVLLKVGPFSPYGPQLFTGWNFPFFLGGLITLGVLVGIVLTAFWLFMLVTCIRDETMKMEQKMPWMLFMLLMPLLGAVLYWCLAYPRRMTSNPFLKQDAM